MVDSILADPHQAAPTAALVALPGTRRGRTPIALRYRRIAWGVGASDLLAFLAALGAARPGALPAVSIWGMGIGIGFLLAPALWLVVFASFSLYAFPRMAPAEEFRRVIGASSVNVLVTLFLGMLLARDHVVVLRGSFAVALLLSVLFVLGERMAWHKVMGRLRRQGSLVYRTLVVGANSEAARLVAALGADDSGYRPVGFVRTAAGAWPALDLPDLGSLGDLPKLVRDSGIESVFVAASAVEPDAMQGILRSLRRSGVEVRVSANMSEIMARRLLVNPVGNQMVLSVRPVRLSGPQAAAKRCFDLVVGGMLLVFSLPLWAVAALAVKLTSQGPVLFRQERIGREGRSFEVFKFRTMVRDAESMLAAVSGRNEASGPLFKVQDDPRVTRVGRILRRFGVDEVPQLLNVMVGDMSLVGPRPPLPTEVDSYEDWHLERLEVRPGITGPWQVGRRGVWSFDDYLRLDLYYVENWSIAYDVFILLKTIPAVFTRRGNF
jgi:exopolysaccharide biosynthesis polyprenyl glycosylphosphotransferase